MGKRAKARRAAGYKPVSAPPTFRFKAFVMKQGREVPLHYLLHGEERAKQRSRTSQPRKRRHGRGSR